MLNSLSYLFVHSFRARCVLLKGCAGQQGQKPLLRFVLGFAASEGREGDGVFSKSELRGFAGKPFEQAGSLQPAFEQAESAGTEVMARKLPEMVGGSRLQPTVKNAGWRARSEGRTDTEDRGEMCFQMV